MKRIIARVVFALGVKPSASFSIAGYTTYGYGKLDDLGHWEYELAPWVVERG